MTGKIHIKVGAIEIEYEGNEEFIKNDLLTFLEKVAEVLNVKIIPSIPTESKTQLQSGLQLTTSSIATKLNVKSGADLILAACVHLHFIKGKSSFSRQDILSEMQTASNYYKQTYGKHLTEYLSGLQKSNKLIENTPNIYAIHVNELQGLEKTLTS